MTPLQVSILLLLAREGLASYLRMEDRLDWKSPSQFRRMLGELIVQGYVQQIIYDPPYNPGYQLTVPRGQVEAARRNPGRSVAAGAA